MPHNAIIGYHQEGVRRGVDLSGGQGEGGLYRQQTVTELGQGHSVRLIHRHLQDSRLNFTTNLGQQLLNDIICLIFQRELTIFPGNHQFCLSYFNGKFIFWTAHGEHNTDFVTDFVIDFCIS